MVAVTAREIEKRELKELKIIANRREDDVAKLEASLAELVKLKTENETHLLEKFSLLLNEKKLKIRDQQRILLGATVDPARHEEVEGNRVPLRSHPAGPSRRGKRKAKNNQESDDESSGFEKMEISEPADDARSNSSEHDQQTPDESTADEASEDDRLSPPRSPRMTVNEAKDNRDHTTAKSSSAAAQDHVPPRRELPFAKKSAPPPKAAPVAEGSETESDNEL